MKKFIALLIGCSLALAVSVQAKEQADQTDAKKHSQKPKNVQKQQFTPKQQQLKTQNIHVQKVHTEHVNKPVVTTTNTPVTKKQQYMAPNQTNTLPAVQSNKIQKNKEQLQVNNQQLQKTTLSQQSITKIRAQHRNFHAAPNTSIASVRFNQNYTIRNANTWSGNNYVVFRTYRPQWHDQIWWRSHHHHLTLIGGGWYFWNGGYWYPAWGYDQSAAYYPYDGPIYSGPSARPFDQVVADVQAVLQEQGLYRGQVDGLLGPLTREALAEYQSSHGLYATETIDQPTLSSLGLAG
jgi:peptidoglycan hydrolase-like protein with peptidoglycan-binding domain